MADQYKSFAVAKDLETKERKGFRVAKDRENYSITLDVRYEDGERMPTADELQRALTQVYAKAFSEATERLETD